MKADRRQSSEFKTAETIDVEEQLRQDLAAAAEWGNMLIGQINQLTMEKQTLEEFCTQAQHDVNNSEQKYEKRGTEITNLRVQLLQATDQVSTLKEQNSYLQHITDSLKETNRTYMKELEYCKSELNSSKEQIQKMKQYNNISKFDEERIDLKRKIDTLQRENKELTRTVESLEMEKQHLQQLNETIPDWIQKANRYSEEKKANSSLKRQVEQQSQEIENLKLENTELNNHVQECVDLLSKTKDKFNLLERMMGDNFTHELFDRHLNSQMLVSGIIGTPTDDIPNIPALEITNSVSLLEDVKQSYRKKDQRKLKEHKLALEMIGQICKNMYTLIHYSLLGKFQFTDDDRLLYAKDAYDSLEEKEKQIASVFAWIKRAKQQVNESSIEIDGSDDEEESMTDGLSSLLERLYQVTHIFQFVNQQLLQNTDKSNDSVQTEEDSKLALLIRTIDTLCVERDDMVKGYEEISREIENMSDEHAKEIEVLTAELEQTKQEFTMIKSGIAHDVNKNNQLQATLEAIKVEKEKLAKELAATSASNATLTQQNNSINDELYDLKIEYETTKEILERTVHDLTQDLKLTQEELGILERKSSDHSVSGELLERVRAELDHTKLERDEAYRLVDKSKIDHASTVTCYEDRVSELESTIRELKLGYRKTKQEEDETEPSLGEDLGDTIVHSNEIGKLVSQLEDRYLWQLGEQYLHKREVKRPKSPVGNSSAQMVDIMKYGYETTKRQLLFLENQLFKTQKELEYHKRYQRHLVVTNSILSFS
jgi:chromosome segregation ATPase